jgi:hypothetical protein
LLVSPRDSKKAGKPYRLSIGRGGDADKSGGDAKRERTVTLLESGVTHRPAN